MYRLLLLFCLLTATPLANAWNAAGHRLAAIIAWQQLTPATQGWITNALNKHPDHERWISRARSDLPMALLAEAACWPDDIRNDTRFYDESWETATPALPGFSDTARHKNWHYADRDADGQSSAGELERQIGRIDLLLRSTHKSEAISYHLPWLIHLVADLHQPLHVGREGDDGGNAIEIENPFNPRLPFSNLHSYWDDLPGPPWLRGNRLLAKARQLLEVHEAPARKNPAQWANESHDLLTQAYPDAEGSLLPTITPAFHQKAEDIALRRVLDAGYRLGWLLEEIYRARVSRETR